MIDKEKEEKLKDFFSCEFVTGWIAERLGELARDLYGASQSIDVIGETAGFSAQEADAISNDLFQLFCTVEGASENLQEVWLKILKQANALRCYQEEYGKEESLDSLDIPY